MTALVYRVLVCGYSIWLGETFPEVRALAIFLFLFGVAGAVNLTRPESRTTDPV